MTDPSEDFDNVAWDVQGDQQASSSFDYHGTDGPAVIDPLSDMNDHSCILWIYPPMTNKRRITTLTSIHHIIIPQNNNKKILRKIH
ncbi:unnamed protein product [Absidia cylindrospora]